MGCAGSNPAFGTNLPFDTDATISKPVRQNGINGVPHAIPRTCFRSWCADVNVSREVAQACLAHVVKGVEASYQRSDLFERRRSVMQKWSDYVTGAQVPT